MARIIPFPGTELPPRGRERVHIRRVVAAAALAELATLGGMRGIAWLWSHSAAQFAAQVSPGLTPERLSAALAPTLGACATYLAGYCVGRSIRDRHELHGLLVGGAAAAFTLTALISAPMPFRILFLAACGVQVLGGFAGGGAARRRVQAPRSAPAHDGEARMSARAWNPPA